jgi:hypothetical protein
MELVILSWMMYHVVGPSQSFITALIILIITVITVRMLQSGVHQPGKGQAVVFAIVLKHTSLGTRQQLHMCRMWATHDVDCSGVVPKWRTKQYTEV